MLIQTTKMTMTSFLFKASPESSATNQTEVFFLPTGSQTQPGQASKTPIVISANVDSVTSSTLSEQTDDNWGDDDDDFCMINDTGWGKAVSFVNPYF